MGKIEEFIDKSEDNIRWWKRAMETDGFESDEEGSYRRDLENTKKELFNLISDELDKAREEGRREYFSMGMEYFSLIEDSNIYQQKGWKLPEEKAKRLQILEKIFNLILKTKEDEK